jgi:colanic acid/amylovoran biosynthesis glycosyltransferase
VAGGGLRDSDHFLLHSVTDPDTGDEEGLPVSILEAMAHALPVISTRHAGIPEAVVEGETGFLVDEGDSAGMAECILDLAKGSGMRSEMGLAGWRRARELFCWDREKKALLEIMGLNGPEP